MHATVNELNLPEFTRGSATVAATSRYRSRRFRLWSQYRTTNICCRRSMKGELSRYALCSEMDLHLYLWCSDWAIDSFRCTF